MLPEVPTTPDTFQILFSYLLTKKYRDYVDRREDHSMEVSGSFCTREKKKSSRKGVCTEFGDGDEGDSVIPVVIRNVLRQKGVQRIYV